MNTLAEAQSWLATHTPLLPPEPLPLVEALNRTLATPIRATALPPHPTAAIDGLAVRAADTEGASDYAPLPIHGTPVQAGQPMPPGTDAVLPPTAHEHGAALAPAPPGQFVTPPGHDAPEGWTLPTLTILQPLHLALFAQLGHATIPVIRRPRLATPDDPLLHALLAAQGAAIATPPDLILQLAPPGAPPSLALCPGETTALGLIENTPAITLPCDPLARATVFALLVAPALRRMQGRPEPAPTRATLARKVTSPLGQQDAIRVRLENGLATPIGPADGTSLVRALEANSLLLVPENSEGHMQGATVEIIPL